MKPDGTYNEIVGTPPDVRVDAGQIPERLTRDALLSDACVQKALTDF